MSAPANNRPNDKGRGRDSDVEILEDLTDQELFARFLRNRDSTAFVILYGWHWKAICECAGTVIKDTLHAEDVAQDVFRAVWKEPEKFKGIRNFKSYLRRMAINRARDLYKREAMFEPQDLEGDLNGAHGFAAAASLTGEAKAQIWQTVRSCLTPAQFQIIEFRFKHVFSLAECANKLEFPRERSRAGLMPP